MDHNAYYFQFNSSNSIQQVAESFIYDLQEEFPSTVYTVFHTGEKLKTEQNRDQENTCVMCYVCTKYLYTTMDLQPISMLFLLLEQDRFIQICLDIKAWTNHR